MVYRVQCEKEKTAAGPDAKRAHLVDGGRAVGFGTVNVTEHNQQGLSSKLHGVVGVQDATERAGPSLHGHGTRGRSQGIKTFGKDISIPKLHLAKLQSAGRHLLEMQHHYLVMLNFEPSW